MYRVSTLRVINFVNFYPAPFCIFRLQRKMQFYVLVQLLISFRKYDTLHDVSTVYCYHLLCIVAKLERAYSTPSYYLSK